MTDDEGTDMAFGKRQVRSGAIWMLVGQGGSNLLRMCSNVVLTYLLLKANFGQQALIVSLFQLLELLSDVGLWVAIVQSPRGQEQRFLNTAWTVQVIRGCILFAAAVIAAPIYARVYDDPELTSLVWLSSVGLLFGAFTSVRLAVLRRRMAIRQLIVFDLSAQCIGAATSIGVALVWPTTFALVVGGLAAAATRLVIGLVVPGPADRFAWDRSALREIVSVGVWTLVNTTLSFLAMQDRLVFGTLVSKEDLGTYYIGWMVASVPAGVIGGMSWSLLLPLVSKYVRDGGEHLPRVMRARRSLLLLGGWSLSGLCAGGPLITDFLYPGAYANAGFMLQCVAVSVWLGVILEQTRGALFASIGKLRWTSVGSAVKLLAVFVLVPAGFDRWGFEGAIFGYIAAELPRIVVTWWISRSSGMSGWRQDTALCLVFAGASALGNLARQQSSGWHATVGMLVVFIVVSACWWPVGGRDAIAFVRRR